MNKACSGIEGGVGEFPALFYKCGDPDCATVVEWSAEHICGGGGTGHGCEKVFCGDHLFEATTPYGDALYEMDGPDEDGFYDLLPNLCKS